MIAPRWLAAAALLAAAAATGASAAPGAPRTLVVCADPNSLPFSNRAGAGLENRLARLLARDMHARIEYVWWAQRRGYVRATLNESRCDLWPGVATGVATVSTTRPYYRSTYVFVTRRDRNLAGLTLDDPRLKTLAIGVQMIGNDATNTPPAHALARRGIIDNIHGYMVYGNYAHPNPASAIVTAVERGEIDVALVWGPVAGYFANRSRVPMRVEPVTPSADGPQLPMVYDVSVGVRHGNEALRSEVEQILEREKPRIDALLRTFHVPPAPDAPKS